jgi:hypothetical protein
MKKRRMFPSKPNLVWNDEHDFYVCPKLDAMLHYLQMEGYKICQLIVILKQNKMKTKTTAALFWFYGI